MTNLQPRKLDPDTYYAKHDLRRKLGIAEDVIDRARTNGRLKTLDLRPHIGGKLIADTRPESLRGEAFLFKGSAVLAWMDEGAPTDPKGKSELQASASRKIPSRPASGSPAVHSSSVKRSNTTVASTYPNPIQTFDQAVQEKMDLGLPRPRAVSKVVKENPQLHRAYLEAHNAQHGRRIK